MRTQDQIREQFGVLDIAHLKKCIVQFCYKFTSPNNYLIFFLVHCLFSEWGFWSKCSASCGQSNGAGTRIRNRYIAVEAKYGGMKCYGSREEFAPCVHCATIPKGYDGPCIGFCPGKFVAFYSGASLMLLERLLIFAVKYNLSFYLQVHWNLQKFDDHIGRQWSLEKGSLIIFTT